MGDVTCSVQECAGIVYGRSWCRRHYDAWRRHGDPLKARSRSGGPRNLVTHCKRGHEYTKANSYFKPDGRRLCRTCRSAEPVRPHNTPGRNQSPEKRRDYRLRTKYGLSTDDYGRMLRLQNGKCAICDRDGIPLFVDHCHETGKVRGLLCHGCNVGIGWLGDRAENVTRAAVYLHVFRDLRAN